MQKKELAFFSKILQLFLWVYCLLMSSLAYAQTASAENDSGVQSKSNAFDVGAVLDALGQMNKKQSRLIFYSPSTSTFKGTATIYFNGVHNETWSRNTFCFLCSSSSVISLGLKSLVVLVQDKDESESINKLELRGACNQYVRLVEDQSPQVLQSVSDQEALVELVTSREQVLSISRVTSAQGYKSAPIQAAPIGAKSKTATQIASVQEIPLGADVLIEFGVSQNNVLGTPGRPALYNLIVNVMANNSSIEHRHVLCDSDPIGMALVNEHLAMGKGQTVRDYCKKNVLQKTCITSEGRGLNALVNVSCGRQGITQDIACYAINRRVKTAISGDMRKHSAV